MTIYNTDAMTADELVAAAHDIQQIIWGRAPELVVETVTDDGETYEALRCPVCDYLVNDSGDLYAVDVSERWNNAEPNMDHHDMDVSGADSDYTETLYYLHSLDAPHIVVPPTGWGESWS